MAWVSPNQNNEEYLKCHWEAQLNIYNDRFERGNAKMKFFEHS